MESINKPLLWFRAAGGIVAVLAIGLLLHRLHPGALAEALHHTRPGWVLVATVLYGLLFLPAAWRWHLALRLSRSEVNFGVTARVSLIGHFFYTIFFGAAGGDVAKCMLYSRWYRKPLPEALVAASLDRLLGFGGLLLFAGIAFGTAAVHDGFAGLRSLSFNRGYWWWLLVPVAAVLLIRRANPPTGNSPLDRFRRTFRENGRRVIASPRIFFPGLLCGLLVQLALSGVLALNLQAVSHAPIPWLQLLWTFPVISLISGLPITVAGLGVRDSAAFALLGMCGVARADAVAASLLTAAVSLVWTLAGGLLLAHEARLRRQKIFGEKWVADPPPLAARKL